MSTITERQRYWCEHVLLAASIHTGQRRLGGNRPFILPILRNVATIYRLASGLQSKTRRFTCANGVKLSNHYLKLFSFGQSTFALCCFPQVSLTLERMKLSLNE